MVVETIGWSWLALKDPTIKVAAEAAKATVTKGGEVVAKKIAIAWQKIGWDEAERKYRLALLQIVRCTKVLGNPTPIEIDRIYTDVFVFDKLSALRRYSESLDEDEHDVRKKLEDRDRLRARDIVESEGNAFILGRPGAGKTTFLKYLAMTACRGLLASTPIFISLKDWSDSALPLMRYMAKQFDMCQFPDAEVFLEALLKRGDALVLLDGLDEVNEWQEKRNQIIREIVNFSNKYPENKYCLTCRTAATDYSFEHFKYVEVADFSPEQQVQFATQWYGSKSPMLDKFLAAWNSERNQGLRDLGRTPLLLTLLCLTFDETHTFPSRLVDVYQEAIDALLKKWDTSRLITRDNFYRDLSHGQRKQLLETIAAEFYFNSRTVFRKAEIAAVAERFIKSLPEDVRSPSADGTEVVRQLEAQHGLVVERAKDLYTFSHLTVQEYFTASFVAKNQNSTLQRQVVKSALHDQKWREVMVYTVALLPQADSMLEEMLRQLLAMKIASSGVLIFLGKCYCDWQLAKTKRVSPGTPAYYLFGLHTSIEQYVGQLRHPSLTSAELAKFVEHIEVLDQFLGARTARAGYAKAAGIVSAATRYFKHDPVNAARLLGGYFLRPEQFISFFYACRLLMECIEVAITAKREYYLEQVLSVTEKDLGAIDEVIRSYH
jgi:hypothetical protein